MCISLDGKSITRKQLWDKLVSRGHTRQFDKLPARTQREYMYFGKVSDYPLYITRAGYYYAVVNYA